MKRIRVKLVERYGSSLPGEIVSLPDHVAIELVANHEAAWPDEPACAEASAGRSEKALDAPPKDRMMRSNSAKRKNRNEAV